jgi:hypothetical protein
MVVIYDSILTEPPSSICCFRDVTLFVKVFCEKDNVLMCPKGTKSNYWRWIKKYGAHDFIEQLITEEEDIDGLSVGSSGSISCDVLNEYNYGEILNLIKSRLSI